MLASKSSSLRRASGVFITFIDHEVIERDLRIAEDGTSPEQILLGQWRQKQTIVRERRSWDAPGPSSDDFKHGRVMGTFLRFEAEAPSTDQLTSYVQQALWTVIRSIGGRRAGIIAEERTAGNEYLELYNCLVHDEDLDDEQRRAIRQRLIDIQAANGIFDRSIDKFKAMTIFDFHMDTEQEQRQEVVWDEYSVRAVQEALEDPSTLIYLSDRMRTLGLAGRAARLALEATQYQARLDTKD